MEEHSETIYSRQTRSFSFFQEWRLQGHYTISVTREPEGILSKGRSGASLPSIPSDVVFTKRPGLLALTRVRPPSDEH